MYTTTNQSGSSIKQGSSVSGNGNSSHGVIQRKKAATGAIDEPDLGQRHRSLSGFLGPGSGAENESLSPSSSSSYGSAFRNSASGKEQDAYRHDYHHHLSETYPSRSDSTSLLSADVDKDQQHIDIDTLTLMEEVVLLGLKDQEGYLSFLNDSISYVLRGCLLMELSFRGRIKTSPEVPRKHPTDRSIEVVQAAITGDTLLDETLRSIRGERHSIAGWIDLLSGESWNPLKIGYQLKQVRERIAKGLVDKGILRTDKKSFLIFDMATHPLADPTVKSDLVRRILDVLLTPTRTTGLDLKLAVLIAAANAANVLDRCLSQCSYAQRESAKLKADSILKEYCNEDVSKNDIVSGVLTVFCRMDKLLY